MVKERVDLLEPLRKGGMDGDVDFLREAVRELVDVPFAGSAADGVAGRRLGACGPKRHARHHRRMGPPLKRHGVGGRHDHHAQAGSLTLLVQFRGHRGRIRRLRTGEWVRITIGGLRLRHII